MLRAIKQSAPLSKPTHAGSQAAADPAALRSPLRVVPRICDPAASGGDEGWRQSAEIECLGRSVRLNLPEDNDAAVQEQYRRLSRRILDEVAPRTPTSIMLAHCELSRITDATALHVSRAIAESIQGRVLVVDGDLAGGGLSDVFGGGDRLGLSDFLQGETSWHASVVAIAESNLFFFPSGQAPVVGLNSAAGSFYRLLVELGDHFDILIFAGVCGSPLVSRFSDAFCAVYLMIELGRTATRSAVEASQQLRQAGAKLIGCILTHD